MMEKERQIETETKRREMERERKREDEERMKVTAVKLPEQAPQGESRVGGADGGGRAKEPGEEVRFDDFSVKPRRWGSQGRALWSSRDSPTLWDERQEEKESKSVPEREEAAGTPGDWSVPVGEPGGSGPASAGDGSSTRREPDETPPQTPTPPPSPPVLELRTEAPEETEEEGEAELVVETDPEALAEGSLTPITPRPDDLINLSPDEPLPGEPDTPSNQETDDDIIDFTPSTDPEPLPLPEFPTSLLDTSAQLAKAELGRRRNRSRPSMPPRPVSQGAPLGELQEAVDGPDDCMFRDSTEVAAESSYGVDLHSEVEPSPLPSQSQRVPVFPGMDPSALKAVLQKRGGDSDGQADRRAPSPLELLRRVPASSHPSPPQLSCPAPSPPPRTRSTKSPIPPGAARVLPPAAGTEDRVESTPPWLQELKSKKQFAQSGGDP
ncbi:uncharacterized protein KIAA1671-like [Anguilla anguilla]|uniref:uncharacterized protein KIAA1671-like n=1 Tax=Anguilla anguilla TaxID=7936 RepID=UPI0015AB1DB1|nr:uncharacterized protein KIAA1671-like [Anguilla anguilla]